MLRSDETKKSDDDENKPPKKDKQPRRAPSKVMKRTKQKEEKTPNPAPKQKEEKSPNPIPKVEVKKEEQQVSNVEEKKEEPKESKVEGKTDELKTDKVEEKTDEQKVSKVEEKKEEQQVSNVEAKKEEQNLPKVDGQNVEQQVSNAEAKNEEQKVTKIEAKKEQQSASKVEGKSSCLERADGLDPWDKVEEKKLRPMEGYHGFLPREDLASMVKNVGEYILRISETEGSGGEKTRDLVLSVMGECTKDGNTAPMMRNMVVFKKDGKYYLNQKKQFDALKDLLEFYKTNPWSFTSNGKTVAFTARTPIPLQKWEYTHKDVKIGKRLGVGAFGEVCGGRLRTKKSRMVDVAIKVAKKTEDVSKEKMKELVNEARLVRNFKNPNVVRTYGVAVDKQPLYIILELVSGGGLNNYLRSHVGETTEKERLSMCLGAARGMAYLHKYNCVHADVAARNCLISEEKVVKISDFGLSFVLGPDETWRMTPNMKLPIKWLAPETITQRQLSIKTDIYTFGVLCYEIFSDGMEPYHTVTNKEAKILIPKGETLEIPGTCPELLRNFLKQRVFAMDPATRPMMPEVVFALQKSGAVDVEVPKKSLDKSK